jgi:hypothetical protein
MLKVITWLTWEKKFHTKTCERNLSQWAVRIGTASFSATKREWGEVKGCRVNFQQKSKQEVFLLLRVFIIMVISLSKLLRVKDWKSNLYGELLYFYPGRSVYVHTIIIQPRS